MDSRNQSISRIEDSIPELDPIVKIKKLISDQIVNFFHNSCKVHFHHDEHPESKIEKIIKQASLELKK